MIPPAPFAGHPPLAPARHVALLRGINVGGKHKLLAPDLVALFGEAGCVEVSTYIQSGNVIFQAPAAGVEGVGAAVRARMARKFGFEVPVILRSGAALRAIAENNPFLLAGCDPATLHVMFLATVPEPDRVATLDPDRAKPDAFAVRGREVYLHVPSSFADTKLTNAYFDKRLATPSTVRNWRTLLELLKRCEAGAAAAPVGPGS